MHGFNTAVVFGIVWVRDVLTDSVADLEETELNVSSVLRQDALCLADWLQ